MKTAKDLKIPFTWAERHPILLDRFFYIPGCYEYKRETIPFFEEDKGIIVEYCSGNGQWIADRAAQNPQYNWIAVEKKFERARQIWLKMQRMGLENLRVVCGEGVVFTRFYAPQVEEVYVNFPDPWPKLRHAKHRLIRSAFLEEVEKVIRPGGQMICVTDDAPYAAQMKEEFRKRGSWKLLFDLNDWPDYGRSYFKDLWIQKGRTIHFLSHEKTYDPLS